MSSLPSIHLDADLVRDWYSGDLTETEVNMVLRSWKPYCKYIEDVLFDFDPETQSWPDVRNAAFECLPDPLGMMTTSEPPGA